MADEKNLAQADAAGVKRKALDEPMLDAADAAALAAFTDADLCIESEDEKQPQLPKPYRVQKLSETRDDLPNPNTAHESDAHPSGDMPSGNEYQPDGMSQRQPEPGNAQYMRHNSQRQHSSERSYQGESRERHHQWQNEQEWAVVPFPSRNYPPEQN